MLLTCTCQDANDVKEHNQLIKLMQFFMGLDDVYLPLRSNILTRDPLPNVKTEISIISRKESHRGSPFSSSNQSNKKKQVRNPNLTCKKCNSSGHTIERCYEIIGYPPNYHKKGQNQNAKIASSNNVSVDKQNSSAPFSDEQMAMLKALLSEKNTFHDPKANMVGNFL